MGGKKARRNQQRHRKERKPHRRKGRAIWFVLGALAVLSVAAFLASEPFRPRPAASEPGGSPIPQVYVSMGGFEPRNLTAQAGQALKVQFVNQDSQFHTDGGGWHQFRIDGVGIDVRIPPSSQPTVTLPALAAGTYEFYCDVCCGGKANPAMRGVLEVKA